MIYRANTASSFIDDHATFQRTDTVTCFIDLEALLFQTRRAIFVNVQCFARWTHALSIDIANEAFLNYAQGSFIALHSCIAGIALQALTNHCAHRHRIQNSAHGIHSAGLCGIAGIYAFASNAGGLRWTIPVILANRYSSVRLTAIASRNSAGWAGALRTMLIHFTDFVDCANCSHLTWAFTFSINTGLVRGTFVIAAAT